MKKILITGANSYIGTSVESHLNKFGDKYIVDTIDMLDGMWREKDFSEYQVVFHVAGIAHSDSGKISEEKAKLYYAVNTDLTIETAQKAKTDGVAQFIFMSSAIVYGDSAPIGRSKLITKDTPVSPANCYGDSKVQAEIGINTLADDSFKVVVLRPPMIYGNGSKGNYPVLSKFARKLPFFPFVKNERSMIYIENFCEFVRLMIENEETGTFWPQNKEYSNTSYMVQTIATVHGKKMRLVKGFTWALKLIGFCTGMVNKAFGNLSYDQKLSVYKEDYQLVSLSESILKTEGKEML
jgi:UDP-glucose 4-epimerase